MKSAISKKAGTAGTSSWTTEEDLVLREHYPHYDLLVDLLPHRSLSSLKHRVRRLGIVARRHIWTNVEVRLLLSAFAAGATDTELKRLFPDLRICQIRSKAGHLKAPHRRGKLVLFDEPALDAIRERSRSIGISLVELDHRSRIGKYFQKSIRQPKLMNIVRAAKVLGGYVTIEWPPSDF